MGDQNLAHAEELAGSILDAVKRTGREVKIVASSDFSHYVPDAQARAQDLYAIEALSALDVEEFYRRIASRGVSACGYGPIATMCLACRGLGASEGRLIRYGTSGDITGDPTVVGYAAIAVI